MFLLLDISTVHGLLPGWECMLYLRRQRQDAGCEGLERGW